MNKTIKIYGIILAAVLVLFTFLELGKTELVNWNKNYDIKQKSPFGLYVFSKEAPALFQNKIEKVNVSPYEYYQQKRGGHHVRSGAPDPPSYRRRCVYRSRYIVTAARYRQAPRDHERDSAIWQRIFAEIASRLRPWISCCCFF